MTDILLLILAPLGGYMLSILIAKRPKTKESLWFGLYTFCQELKNNVVYDKSALTDFAKLFTQRHSDLYACEVITSYLLDSDNSKLHLPVKEDEAQVIERFFAGLYAPNAEALLQHVEYFAVVFKDYQEKQSQGNAKTLPLYNKLGVLCGIAVALLLI